MREYEGGEESPRGGTDMNKRRLNYTLSLVVVLSFLLVLGLSGCTTLTSGEKDFSGPTRGFGEGSPNTFPLYAGQTIPVGEVQVWNDDENVCVKYQLSDDAIAEGWLIYETHLAVGATLGDIPQTKKGNPIPGQFPYGDDDLDGVESYQECVPLPAGVSCDDDIIIAAHAVVEKTECEIITEAPYGGLKVVNYAQGLRYDYTSVRSERSNPNAVLAFEEGHNESYFFSLGFNEDRSGYSDVDAWIIVEFDKPIQNGTGNDLRVVEDTWGLPYPDETADVWVSKNGTDWKYLGEADNQNPMSSYHTITDFDLDDVGLDWAKFVKVQNTSVRDDFARLYPGQGSTLDGYDLNAILALQNYQECTTYSETAWGAGDRFVEQGNWATYITYTVECEEEPELTEGCSHGYWENVEKHPWPNSYKTDDKLSEHFGTYAPDLTLIEALKYSGSDWPSKLAREAVAALLNAASGMNYALSVDEVKSLVSSEFQYGNESSIEALHTKLEKFNAHSGLNGTENCPL